MVASPVDVTGYTGTAIAQDWEQPNSSNGTTSAQPTMDLQGLGQLGSPDKPMGSRQGAPEAASSGKSAVPPESSMAQAQSVRGSSEHAAGATPAAKLAATGGNKPEVAKKHAGLCNANPPRRRADIEQPQNRTGLVAAGPEPTPLRHSVPHPGDLKAHHKRHPDSSALHPGPLASSATAALAGSTKVRSTAAGRTTLPPPPPSSQSWHSAAKAKTTNMVSSSTGMQGPAVRDIPPPPTFGPEQQQAAGTRVEQGMAPRQDGRMDTSRTNIGTTSAAAKKTPSGDKPTGSQANYSLDAQGRRNPMKRRHTEGSSDEEQESEEFDEEEAANRRLIAQLQAQDSQTRRHQRPRRAAAENTNKLLKMYAAVQDDDNSTVAVQRDANFKIASVFARPIIPPGKRGTYDEELLMPPMQPGGKPRVLPACAGRDRSPPYRPRKKKQDSGRVDNSTHNNNNNSNSNHGSNDPMDKKEDKDNKPAPACPDGAEGTQQQASGSRPHSLQAWLPQGQPKLDNQNNDEAVDHNQDPQPPSVNDTHANQLQSPPGSPTTPPHDHMADEPSPVAQQAGAAVDCGPVPAGPGTGVAGLVSGAPSQPTLAAWQLPPSSQQGAAPFAPSVPAAAPQAQKTRVRGWKERPPKARPLVQEAQPLQPSATLQHLASQIPPGLVQQLPAQASASLSTNHHAQQQQQQQNINPHAALAGAGGSSGSLGTGAGGHTMPASQLVLGTPSHAAHAAHQPGTAPPGAPSQLVNHASTGQPGPYLNALGPFGLAHYTSSAAITPQPNQGSGAVASAATFQQPNAAARAFASAANAQPNQAAGTVASPNNPVAGHAGAAFGSVQPVTQLPAAIKPEPRSSGSLSQPGNMPQSSGGTAASAGQAEQQERDELRRQLRETVVDLRGRIARDISPKVAEEVGLPTASGLIKTMQAFRKMDTDELQCALAGMELVKQELAKAQEHKDDPVSKAAHEREAAIALKNALHVSSSMEMTAA